MTTLSPSRVFFALLATPWIFVATAVGLDQLARGAASGSVSGGFTQGLWVMLLICYAGLLFFAIPLLWLLDHKGWASLAPLVLAGAVTGSVLYTAVLVILGHLMETSGPIKATPILFGAGVGAYAACVFGLLAGVRVRQRRSPK